MTEAWEDRRSLRINQLKKDLDIDITSIESDSRKVKKGGLFVAIKGFEADGNDYIKAAIKKGAIAIMAEPDIDKDLLKLIVKYATIIIVPDTRLALALAACNFYDNPSKKFKLIGITGTKGKTTTSFMVKKILEKQGLKVGLIGTIATYIGTKKVEDSDRTTPESNKLQFLFSKMVEHGCDAVIMEVSSQSLKLNRVAGCDFDIAVFTNFSEDHISPKEHPDMKDYFESKLKLLKMSKVCYSNADDLMVAKVPKLLPDSKVTTYGIDNFCNLLAKDITITNAYVDFKVKIENKNERVKVCIPGRFSVYNALAAIAIAKESGIKTITLIVAGRNVLVSDYINDWDSCIMCYLPGTEGGRAVASSLMGESEYTGTLPMPYYASTEDIDNGKVLYPVGFSAVG